MYTEYEIRQLPLTLRAYRQRVERFLAENSLRLDDVDYYAGVYAVGDDELLAGGGLKGNVIKCIAVGNRLRDEGMSNISKGYPHGDRRRLETILQPSIHDKLYGVNLYKNLYGDNV